MNDLVLTNDGVDSSLSRYVLTLSWERLPSLRGNES